MRKLNTSISNNKDTVLKSFWRDNAHFADLFNATVFNGKQVLSPDNLIEMDTESCYVVCNRHRSIQPVLYEDTSYRGKATHYMVQCDDDTHRPFVRLDR